MKLKITIAVLLVVIVGAIFLLKSNNNGGEVMAAAESTTKVNSGKKVLISFLPLFFFFLTRTFGRFIFISYLCIPWTKRHQSKKYEENKKIYYEEAFVIFSTDHDAHAGRCGKCCSGRY